MPVRELVAVRLVDGDCVRIAVDSAGRDRVDRCSVRSRDVDAEVEGAAGAGIVERAPDRMLLVERLHRPAVCAREGRRQERHDACREHRYSPDHDRRDRISRGLSVPDMHIAYGGVHGLIQIRNAGGRPPDARARAAEEGRSLSDYLLVQLTELARLPTLKEMTERIRRRSSVELPKPAAEIIREAREERDRQLGARH